MNGVKHKSRFDRWKSRTSKQTRALAELVETRLTSRLERDGFLRVDVSMQDPKSPIRGNEIQLEKPVEDGLDCIDVTFAKYGVPRFQVGCARRRLVHPNEFVRAGMLVASANEYLHFWGKPWWRPVWSWSDEDAVRVVGVVEEKLGQLLRFLDTGEVGPNIHAQNIPKRNGTV